MNEILNIKIITLDAPPIHHIFGNAIYFCNGQNKMVVSAYFNRDGTKKWKSRKLKMFKLMTKRLFNGSLTLEMEKSKVEKRKEKKKKKERKKKNETRWLIDKDKANKRDRQKRNPK